jgi:hypothetical protein
MPCTRCERGLPADFIIASDVLEMRICVYCKDDFDAFISWMESHGEGLAVGVMHLERVQ